MRSPSPGRAISRHLEVLRDAGPVTNERRVSWGYYRNSPDARPASSARAPDTPRVVSAGTASPNPAASSITDSRSVT